MTNYLTTWTGELSLESTLNILLFASPIMLLIAAVIVFSAVRSVKNGSLIKDAVRSGVLLFMSSFILFVLLATLIPTVLVKEAPPGTVGRFVCRADDLVQQIGQQHPEIGTAVSANCKDATPTVIFRLEDGTYEQMKVLLIGKPTVEGQPYVLGE